MTKELNELLQQPLFQKMIEIAAERTEKNPEYLNKMDLEELKDAAQLSLYKKMLEFRSNKDDMDLMAKKIYIKINLNEFINKMEGIK